MNLNSDTNDQLNEEVNDEKSALLPRNHTATNAPMSNRLSAASKSSLNVKRTSTSRRSQSFGLHSSTLLHAMNDTRSKSSQNVSIIILLIINCFERFAYYGVICNFVLYLNKMPLNWSSSNSSILLLISMSLSYMSSLIGGWVADSYLGKYTVICLSFVVYIISYTVFPLISWRANDVPNYCKILTPSENTTEIFLGSDRGIFEESCSFMVVPACIAMAFAVGFIKANLGPFGADQVYSRGQAMVFKYFNWLYWSINLGSLLCFIFLAFIQQNYSFFIGFIIPWIALAFSFILFLSGSGCYVKSELEKSVLTNVVRVIVEAYRSVNRRKNLIRQTQRERALLSEEEEENRSETDQTYEGYYSASNSFSTSVSRNISWLDNAKIRYGGRFDDGLVDDVKTLKKIVILFSIMIPYWLVYVQIETMFVVQGLHMRVFKDNSSFLNLEKFVMPVAWLSLSDQFVILLMIPFLDYFVYPFFKRHFNFEGSVRLVIGMTFSALAVALAGFLETCRVQYILDNPDENAIVQSISNTTYVAANLSIMWQFPQYILVGLGEVFCSVSAVYFAYSAAPKSMQSILMGMFYFFTGIGSAIGSVLLYSFKTLIYSPLDSDDLNCKTCRLNYYFYLLSALQIFGILMFIWSDYIHDITGDDLREHVIEEVEENDDAEADTSHHNDSMSSPIVI